MLREGHSAKYATVCIVSEQNRGLNLESEKLDCDRSTRTRTVQTRRSAMLRWAVGFFVIALIAAVLGFGGIAAAAAGIAKVLFYIFLILFLAALLGDLVRRT
jgi:uncharacterized membrane protein YtjA (UPF0391 family)